ncbi:hypothetical protein ZIOFF_046471 [Zingiber officinale]|uniref:Protein kinase domain-containing protein n=1 Tax=Zingiber officinale TaxID=94328 RepID=A0A8J5KVV3_ZINOF|nr:hypothetical protein ZIOFF_046471 [Zingiber officinale]
MQKVSSNGRVRLHKSATSSPPRLLALSTSIPRRAKRTARGMGNCFASPPKRQGDTRSLRPVNLEDQQRQRRHRHHRQSVRLKQQHLWAVPQNILGEGGFGRVYKGVVEEKTLNPSKSGTGMVVAVKKLNPESMQGLEEWQSEVNFLGRLSHPNLVKLMGYCSEDKELLLVYEYLSRGSLENHLFRRGATFESLSWNTRLKIAIGAARGLAFLHSSKRQVIYRDFKASNILLDVNYNAKLSDFGLAKYGPMGGDSHVTTRVMGTNGYAAPEYVATGHLYVKSDVYGFGVVLLEMLTGQRALDSNRPSGQHKLVDWAMPMLGDRRKLARLMDPRLEGQYSSKGAYQATQLTVNCLAGEPKSRPSMKQVVETLENIEAMKTRSRNVSSRSMARNHDHAPMHGNSALHLGHETPARCGMKTARQTCRTATR